jgi:predicted nucleic acid-binding protein
MDRLFLDANVLFSAAHKPDARVFRLCKLDDVVLCSSHYALEEARFNLVDGAELRRLVELTDDLQFIDSAHTALPRGISLPEKDIPILLAAIEAKANYLLTGDLRHFGPYFGKKIGGVTVLSPGKYLKLREDDERR